MKSGGLFLFSLCFCENNCLCFWRILEQHHFEQKLCSWWCVCACSWWCSNWSGFDFPQLSSLFCDWLTIQLDFFVCCFLIGLHKLQEHLHWQHAVYRKRFWKSCWLFASCCDNWSCDSGCAKQPKTQTYTKQSNKFKSWILHRKWQGKCSKTSSRQPRNEQVATLQEEVEAFASKFSMPGVWRNIKSTSWSEQWAAELRCLDSFRSLSFFLLFWLWCWVFFFFFFASESFSTLLCSTTNWNTPNGSGDKPCRCWVCFHAVSTAKWQRTCWSTDSLIVGGEVQGEAEKMLNFHVFFFFDFSVFPNVEEAKVKNLDNFVKSNICETNCKMRRIWLPKVEKLMKWSENTSAAPANITQKLVNNFLLLGLCFFFLRSIPAFLTASCCSIMGDSSHHITEMDHFECEGPLSQAKFLKLLTTLDLRTVWDFCFCWTICCV